MSADSQTFVELARDADRTPPRQVRGKRGPSNGGAVRVVDAQAAVPPHHSNGTAPDLTAAPINSPVGGQVAAQIICACGCGRLLPARRSRWVSDECRKRGKPVQHAVDTPPSPSPRAAAITFPSDADDAAAWVERALKGADRPEDVVAAIPEDAAADVVTAALRELKAAAGFPVGASRSILADRRREQAEADGQEAAGALAEALKANRDSWVRRIRVVGGHLLQDVSNKQTLYSVIPRDLPSWDGVLGALRDVPDDVYATDTPMCGGSGGARKAWVVSLNLTVPDATVSGMRKIPAPQFQVLHQGELRPLVITAHDVPVQCTADDIARDRWITMCGSRPGTGLRMAGILRDAFTVLAEQCPVMRKDPQADARGRLQLLPRGAVPPGHRELAPGSDRESATVSWKRAMDIVGQQPGGLAAHVCGAAVDAYYLRVQRRQSHTIDVSGRDLATGKTTLQQLVAAMIGDPDQVLVPCDMASPVSATTLAGQIGYGVMNLNESQLFDGNPDERGRMLFRLAERSIRIRSKPDGSGVNASLPFGGLTLLSGNMRFVSAEVIDAIFPGMSRRYLLFPASQEQPVFTGDLDATEVRDLSQAAYGWLIPLVVEQVTVDEYRERVQRTWRELCSQHLSGGSGDPEVLRLLAGHLTGASLVDRLLGSQLEAATREHIADWLTDVAHKTVELYTIYLNRIRDHVQEHPDQWYTPAQYAQYLHRSRAGDDAEPQNYLDRCPVGIRAEDDSWFAVLSQSVHRELCREFEIADPDEVLRSLDKAGLLQRTGGDRKGKQWTTLMGLGTVGGQQRRARVYHVLAPPVHECGDDTDATAPAASNGSGPQVGTDEGPPDPFEGTVAPAPAEPARGTPVPVSAGPLENNDLRRPNPPHVRAISSRARPNYLPDPVVRDADGSYCGVVKAVNSLLDTQDRKGRAQVHRHPYRDDESIPPPLRLLGRGQGTGVHEGFHNHRADLPVGAQVTILDRNGAYLPAIGSALLPLGALTRHEDGAGPDTLTGIYRVAAWPALTESGKDLPHPWGKPLSHRAVDLWLTRSTLDIGRECMAEGLLETFTVVEALLAPPLKEGRPGWTRWEWLYKELRSVREAALETGDEDTLGFVKALYSTGVSTLGESGSNTRIWRPELPPIIRSTAFALLWRMSRRAACAGLTVAALTGNDELHIAATPAEVFVARHPDGKPALTEGRDLGQIKVKGGYVIGPDGGRTAEWGTDHA